MQTFFNRFQNSAVNRFFRSFSPSSRAAMLFAVPFAVVDAAHYYTGGSALALTLPALVLFYLGCGAVAAGISVSIRGGDEQSARDGWMAGLKLWLISTLANMLISLLVGALSLGMTLILGIPALLCAPLHALFAALTAWLGALAYRSVMRRAA